MTRLPSSMTAMVLAIMLGFSPVSGVFAQVPSPVATSPFRYADVADLATIAPMVIDVEVRKASILSADRAPGVAAGHARFFVEGSIVSLIRGNSALASRLVWLVDLPLDAKAKPPRLKKKQRLILFANPTAIAGGGQATSSVQLVTPDGQLNWDPATETLTRRILNEVVSIDAPPAVTGIANGFHQRGTLPGESETQFFIETATGAPMTLTVLRAPGTAPRWAAAFGEIVDGTAGVPARSTLGWYRLACGLPRQIAEARLATADPDERAAMIADYRFILAQLGDCPRNRTPPRR